MLTTKLTVEIRPTNPKASMILALKPEVKGKVERSLARHCGLESDNIVASIQQYDTGTPDKASANVLIHIGCLDQSMKAVSESALLGLAGSLIVLGLGYITTVEIRPWAGPWCQVKNGEKTIFDPKNCAKRERSRR